MSAELVPPIDDVADLLVGMMRTSWPTTEADRLRYFAALGLRDTGPIEDDDTETVSGWFSASLPETNGIWSAFRGEFLGLDLFLYHSPPRSAAVRAGYRQLGDQLTRSLGSPVEEWGPEDSPASFWQTDQLGIEMYCHQRLDSCIQVGPSHLERSAANDAAHQ